MRELIELDSMDTCARSLRAGIKIRAEPVHVALVERSNISRHFHHLDSVPPGITIFLHSCSNGRVIVAVIVLLPFYSKCMPLPMRYVIDD